MSTNNQRDDIAAAAPVFVVSNGPPVHVVIDSGAGESVTITAPLNRQADAASVSVALSTEDVAVLNAANLAQASTTATQTGPLIQGATTTAAPSYTTAKTNPLSLTTAGELRVALVPAAGSIAKAEDVAAVDGDVGVPLLAVRRDAASSGVTTDGDYANLSVTSDGSLRVAVSASSSAVTQGSTTSGQSGMLGMGAVTTAAPAYTNAQTSPVSLTLNGGTRIEGVAGGADVPISTKGTVVVVTPTVTAGSYTANRIAGGLMTFASAAGTKGTCALNAISITCKTVQTDTITCYVFDANPTASTWTDTAAAAITGADIQKNKGVYVLANPLSGLGTHTIWTLENINREFSIGASGSLYIVMVRSGTTAYGSTSDLQVAVSINQD